MQYSLIPIIDFLISALITFFAIKLTLPLFKKLIPAKPTLRGMHKIIKPTSGGIFFIVVFSILGISKGYYLGLFSIPLAIVGLLDDKLNLSKLIRYIAQIITLIAILIYLNQIETGIFYTNQNIFFLISIIFFGSAIINFINFMDGIDGLICGSMIIIFSTLNSQLHYLIPLIGALIAFLRFNWSPSKIFMGDTGSLFLGSFLVSLLYSSETNINLIKNLLLCSPLLLDSFICIIRRLINKQNIFKSHKLHLYQRLVSNGLSHGKVSLIYMLSILFLSIVYNFLEIKFLYLSVLIVISIGIFIDKKYAVKFNN